jgi:hypothetical protein
MDRPDPDNNAPQTHKTPQKGETLLLAKSLDRNQRDRKRHANSRMTDWLETQRGKPQYRPPPRASRAVNKLIKPLAKKAGGSTANLRPHWPQIMGSKLARVSKASRYASGLRGRTLVIEAPSAAPTLIMSNKTRILERIEKAIGPHDIVHIKVIHRRNRENAPIGAPKSYAPPRGLTPSEQAEIEQSLSKLKNKALRPALEKLGKKLYTRR